MAKQKKQKLPRPMTFVKPIKNNPYFAAIEAPDILYVGTIKNAGHSSGFFIVDGELKIGWDVNQFTELE